MSIKELAAKTNDSIDETKMDRKRNQECKSPKGLKDGTSCGSSVGTTRSSQTD